MGDYERTLLSQAGPYVLAARAREIFTQEVTKGCEPVIWPQPVVMEPDYSPLLATGDANNQTAVSYDSSPGQDTIRLKVWISPQEHFNWNRSEQFLKQLTVASSRIGLEITGNQDRIFINILCSEQDVNIIDAALSGKLGHCRISPSYDEAYRDLDVRDWARVKFTDFYPPAPYFYLLTRHDELKQSPYDTLIRVLSKLPSNGLGIFQILFEPVAPEHDWHRNIQMLTDLEYMVKQINNMGIIQRYAQQAPSGDIHNMAGKLETKAHNDKPFFAVAFRMGVLGTDNNEEYLKSLSVLSGLFQYGGRPLNCATDLDYKDSLSVYQIEKMFLYGLTHRTGFLLNTSGLVGLAHIPPAEIFDDLETSFDMVEPLASEHVNFKEGTPIGYTTVADRTLPVVIPLRKRLGHTHIMGKPDTGKSLLLEHHILDDIKKDYGLALIDPHGDLAEGLLDHIPEEFIDKVIYFDPGNPDYIPIWNPIWPVAGQDISRTVDNMIGILKSFVTGWGDRMEHILRQALWALMHISGTSLLDVFEILQHKSKASEEIRKMVLEVLEDGIARQFWQQDILSYAPTDLGPAKHKLSKFLLGGPVSLMLSQPHSLINFHNIMNDGMIFIANLSNIGTELRNILGGFQLSIMHMVALSRSRIPKSQRRVFFIYLDEAYRFITDSLEETITETRKYKVGLTFAHQNLEQLSAPKIGALSSVGTKIIFNVEGKEAIFLSKHFRDEIKPEDFHNLDVGDSIVRIGNKITKIRTHGPLDMPERSFKNEIIEHSINNYYRPAEQVRKMIANRNQRNTHPFTPLAADCRTDSGAEFKREYDRFIEK